MPHPQGYLIRPGDVREFEAMLSQWRRNRFRYDSGGSSAVSRPLDEPQGYPVMLLENLAAKRTVAAEKLRFVESSYVLDVVILGWPTDPNIEVEVRVDDKPILIPIQATAEEFQQLTQVTGQVTLGGRDVVRDGVTIRLTPGRWRIEWNSEADAQKVVSGDVGTNWFSRVEQTLFVGTGIIVKVCQAIPTGFDTPLRAGAICETFKGTGGYRVVGAEARFWYSTDTGGYSY